MEQQSLNLPPKCKPRTVLDMKESFHLIALVTAEYGAKRLDDKAFAAYAAEKLGFSVTGFNVGNIRRQFGIPASRVVITSKKSRPRGRQAALEAALLDTTTRVQRLEEQVATLLRERAGGRSPNGH